jgi:hypothetical protein
MQPYEFGMRVGQQLQKRAGWAEGNWIPSLGETKSVAFGDQPLLNQIDPTQRGAVQDLALYSNPITGVPTALNDTARHLYNGRYLESLGSVAGGALSFLPGFGFAAGQAGRAVAAGGRALAGAGMKQTGNLLTKAPAFVNAGAKAFAPHAGKLNAAAFAPAATALGGLAMNSMGGASAPQQPQQPAPPPPRPQTTFRPKPMLNF